MAFTPTDVDITSRLQEIEKIGLYSYTAFDWLSPILGSVMFWPEMLGLAKSKSVNMRNLYIDATTTKDGRKLQWKRLRFQHKRDLAAGAEAVWAVSVTLTDAEGFSIGDQIKHIELATGVETKYEVASVAWNVVSLQSPLTVAIAANDPIIRISYSKGFKKAIDRVEYDLEDSETFNYLQDFGTIKTFDIDEINSHMQVWPYMSNALNPKSSSKTGKDAKIDRINNYLQTVFAQKIGIEMFGDIGRQFYGGKLFQGTVGADRRSYSGGLDEACNNVIDTLDYTSVWPNGINSDRDRLFEAIWNRIFDIKMRAAEYGNKNVVIAGNQDFTKMFATLASDKVMFDTERTEYGFELTTLTLVGQLGAVSVVHDPLVDQLCSKTGVPEAYIIPLDMISAHRRYYTDMDGMQNSADLVKWPADILIQKSIASQDSLDAFQFYFAFNCGFVFAGWEDNIYRHIQVINYDFTVG